MNMISHGSNRSEVIRPVVSQVNRKRTATRGSLFNADNLYSLAAILVAVATTRTLIQYLLGPRDGSLHHSSQDVPFGCNLKDSPDSQYPNQDFRSDACLASWQSTAGKLEHQLTEIGQDHSFVDAASTSNVSSVHDYSDDNHPLPAVSGAWWPQKDRLKELVIKGHSSTREIPDYPLDRQPNPDRVTHIDADLRSCLGPARAQLKCGACYAFSWNSLLEWHYCKQTGTEQVLLDLSEQHIIDCSNYGGFNRCESGKIEDVRRFAEHFGYYLEQEYPYTAKYKEQTDRCLSKRRFRTFEWKRLIVNRTEWERVLEEQPILVQASLPSDIMSYKHGIHPGNNCDDRMLHGMLLVGHGREGGEPYWLIRNSMGPKWGEGGHFRLARNDSTMSQCFATGWVGKFKFDSLDSDGYDDFYSQIGYEPTEHILRARDSNRKSS